MIYYKPLKNVRDYIYSQPFGVALSGYKELNDIITVIEKSNSNDPYCYVVFSKIDTKLPEVSDVSKG